VLVIGFEHSCFFVILNGVKLALRASPKGIPDTELIQVPTKVNFQANLQGFLMPLAFGMTGSFYVQDGSDCHKIRAIRVIRFYS